MNLLKVGPELNEGEWEVLWYAASFYAGEPFFTKPPLVSYTPGTCPSHMIPKTELLMLNIDKMIQALKNRMAVQVTHSETTALEKLLKLKRLEKKPQP